MTFDSVRNMFLPSQGAEKAPEPTQPLGQGGEYPGGQQWDAEDDPDLHLRPGTDLYVPQRWKVPAYGPAPPKNQNEPPATGVESFEDVSGAELRKELSFPAHSVLIDNLTNQWLYFVGAGRFVPPYQWGVVLPMIRASQVAMYTFAAPTGYTQATAISGQKVTTIWAGVMMGLSSGSLVSPFALSFGKGLKNRSDMISIGTSAASIASANINRKSITIQNEGAAVLYIGKDANVTANTTPPFGGYEVAASGGVFNDTTSIDAWFGIVASGTQAVSVIEVT